MPKLLKDPEYPNLKRDPKTGTYYLRKYVTGRGEVCISLKEKGRSKAIRIMNQVLAEWLSTKHQEGDPFIEDVADELLEIYQMKAEATFENFEIHWRCHIKPYFLGYPISTVAAAIPRYVAHQKTVNPKRKLGHDIRHIHRILNHSVQSGYLDRFVRYKLDAKERQAEPGREYSNSEIKKILKALSPSHRLQALLMLFTGMRPGEARCLRWEHVDFRTSVIRLPASVVKTRYGRQYAVAKDILSELKAQDSRDFSPFVFPNEIDPQRPMAKSAKGWQRAEAKCGVRIRPHWFRHTFATRARREGFGDGEICKNLGMSASVLNRVYTHPSLDDRKRMSGTVGETLPEVL